MMPVQRLREWMSRLEQEAKGSQREISRVNKELMVGDLLVCLRIRKIYCKELGAPLSIWGEITN